MKLFSCLLTLVRMAVALTFTGLATSAIAAVTTNDPVSVSMSLDTPSTVTLGEPIILHYKVTNLDPNNKMGIQFGVYKNAWYTLGLIDQAGKPIDPVTDKRPAKPPGLYIPGDYLLDQAGSRYDAHEGYAVITQSFVLVQPGKYLLTARVHLPYIAAPVSETVFSQERVGKPTETLIQDFVIPITVSPTDATRLRQVSESLRQLIVSEKNDEKYKAVLAALFTIPEIQASSSWEALVNQADWTNREVIAEQLAKVHSIKTVDFLVHMLDNPALSYDEKSFIRTKIDESYNAGDGTVKGHIKALAASRGGTMPEKVVIPQAGD